MTAGMIIDQRRPEHVRHPAPQEAGDEGGRVGEHQRHRHQRGGQRQILLQMRGEQREDRVVDGEAACHPPAGGQRVGEIAALEDGEQRQANLLVLLALLPAVLQPDLRFLDVFAHPDDDQRRQDADPQQATPADAVVEQTVGRGWKPGSRGPTSLAGSNSSVRASAAATIPWRATHRPAIPLPCRCRAGRGRRTGRRRSARSLR